MLTFLPSRTIAEPFSPSRVRCAAPNTRRALDRSGRLCKISPLGRKAGLRKAKSRQNQNKIKTYLTSPGILMEGVLATLRLLFAKTGVNWCYRDVSTVTVDSWGVFEQRTRQG